MLISDILENRLTKPNFDLSSRIESCCAPNSEQISQNVLSHVHELIHHLYMSFDIKNLQKLLTSYKVLQIFDSHRLRYANEYLDLCNYIRLVKSQEDTRTVLIKNLTKFLPEYDFEIIGQNIQLKVYQNEHYDSFSKAETDDYFNKESIELSNSADYLIDNLIDSTSSEYTDSATLLLVNRSLILNDLMKFLDDKFYFQNYAFSILNCVHGIVTQVFKINFIYLSVIKCVLYSRGINFEHKFLIN